MEAVMPMVERPMREEAGMMEGFGLEKEEPMPRVMAMAK
jgi:hypothetical protein